MQCRCMSFMGDPVFRRLGQVAKFVALNDKDKKPTRNPYSHIGTVMPLLKRNEQRAGQRAEWRERMKSVRRASA